MFAEDENLDNIKFSDEKFKNQLVKLKDITELLKGAEDIFDKNESSSGKSEPKMGEATDIA